MGLFSMFLVEGADIKVPNTAFGAFLRPDLSVFQGAGGGLLPLKVRNPRRPGAEGAAGSGARLNPF
jgi:hypothetical protein